jgi:raffinose/stachyose/melibiose transport system substrate-binding protein
MKKTIVMLLVAVLSVGLVFAGGSSEASSGSAAKGKTIVYWSMWNEAEPQGQVIAQAIDEFTKTTGIKVDANFNGRDIRKTLQPALDAGETIDLFDEDIERVANTWGKYLLNLDPYMGKVYGTTNGKPYDTQINQTLLGLAKQLGGGHVMNVPYQPSTFVVMYNKDLFEKAGITSVPTNWDEFTEVCKKLVAVGVTPITVDDAYMAAFFGYNMSRLAGMEKTLAMVKNNDFTDPAVLRFGEIWSDFAKKGYISQKAASNIYPAGQIEEIATGKVAMYLNGTWLPNEIKGSAPNLRWGSFAWPAMNNTGNGPETNNYGSQSFGINKNSKVPEETFQLIVWLTTGKWDAKLAEESIGVPMGNDSQWPEQLKEAKAVIDATTIRMPWACGMEDNPEINVKIKENFGKLITGALDAKGFAQAMTK